MWIFKRFYSNPLGLNIRLRTSYPLHQCQADANSVCRSKTKVCVLFHSNLIWIGQQIDPPGKEQTCKLEFSTENCVYNSTEKLQSFQNFDVSILSEDSNYSNTGISYLFHFSYVYMGTMGVLTSFVISYFLSFIFYVYRNKKIPPLKPTWTLMTKAATN